MTRRVWAGLWAAALLTTLLPAVQVAAQVPPAERLAGSNRFATAAAASAATFMPGVEVAFVATGENFPDALAGGPLAGLREAPILLVARDTLPQETADELARLAPGEITVLGGPPAVSDAVVAALATFTDGSVGRLAGPNRFGTAAAVSAAGFAPGVTNVFVATGGNFPDALAGGAAGAATGSPVLLVNSDSIPAETAAELQRLAPRAITVLGGAPVVADAVLAGLQDFTDGAVRRLAGPNRFATAAAVAADAFPDGAPAVFLATGGNFPDALAGGPAAGLAPGPLLLVNPDCAPADTVAAVERLDPQRLVVLGGTPVVSDAAAALQPCGAQPPPGGESPPPDGEPLPPDGELPPPTFAVDPGLQPGTAELPPHEPGGPARPVARLGDGLSTTTDFVVGELVVVADRAALDGLLGRWDGEVVATYDPSADGLEGPPTHVVRFDPALADPAGLPGDARSLDPLSRGAHGVSSQAGLGTLAASGAESADGIVAALNVLQEPAGLIERGTTEGDMGAGPGDLPYSTNAFAWAYMDASNPMGMGIAEAWRMLAAANRLGNRIRVAAVDGGFGTNPESLQDLPAVLIPVNNGAPNQRQCTGGSACPWHGTNVASALAAVPDNGIGAAGAAGPVAELIMVESQSSMFEFYRALGTAFGRGARVINSSVGFTAPATVSWTLAPIEIVTDGISEAGGLVVAAAGNNGADVDAEDCFFACWEETNHSPCEDEFVLCVGGVSSGTRSRHPSSNFGDESCESKFCSVQLFGPFTVFVGPDPDPNNGGVENPRSISGTSFSSPIVAGVAGLVLAANPSLSGAQVKTILLDTANTSEHGQVSRVLNASAAVRAALGNVPPTVAITAPSDGASVPYGVNTSFTTATEDYEDGSPCCLLRYTSDNASDAGPSPAGQYQAGSPGPRRITVTATDSAGAVGIPAAITVNAVNTPPEVSIASRPTGEVVRGLPYAFVGTVADQNQGAGIGCDALSWTVQPDDGSAALQGCRPRITFPAGGIHGVTLAGSDEQGARTTDFDAFDVQVPPPNSAPRVSILNPVTGDVLQSGASHTLEGAATSDEAAGHPISFRWTERRAEDGVTTELGTTATLSYACMVPPATTGRFDRTLTLHTTDDDGTDTASVDIICERPLA